MPHQRCGPEFRALKLPKGVDAGIVGPGKLRQNGCVESLFDKLLCEQPRTGIHTGGAEIQDSLTFFSDDDSYYRPQQTFGLKRP